MSIIIPVYNDAISLQRCLERLHCQTYPHDRLEIIVVDNGSNPPIEAEALGFPGVVLLREDRPSSYAARNMGVRHATADVLAFVDSDCIPAHDWVERGVWRLLETHGRAMVAGRVPVFFRDPTRPTAVELFESVTAFPQEEYINKMHFGGAGNLFTHRWVFDKVGLFNDRLQSGGDVEWGQRVWRAGLRQVYAEDVVALHPARYTFADLWRKRARIVAGIRRPGRSRIHSLATFVKACRPPVRQIHRLLRSPGLSGAGAHLKVVIVAIGIHLVKVWEMARLELGCAPKWR